MRSWASPRRAPASRSGGATKPVLDSSCILDDNLRGKALLSFSPVIFNQPIALRPDELSWAAKYSHGVFAFYQQGQKEYFGIAFQNHEPVALPYTWEVPRKYHPPDSKGNYNKTEVTCRYPMTPGTFQPIAAPIQQIELFRQLLAIADQVDRNLNCEILYDKFIRQHGFVSNYRSYFEGVWWIDLRLSALLLSLEKTVITEGSGRQITKGDLFAFSTSTELTIPKIDNQLPVENQLKEALELCISCYGEIHLEAIAQAVDLPVDIVEDRLRELKLIFRSKSY